MLFQSKLPLKQTSSFFLVWISMLMTFIASLALLASMCLTNIIGHWNDVISGSLTIQQPTYDLAGNNREEVAMAEIEQIQQLLAKQAFVKSSHLLDEKEMDKLMVPWLGNLATINELPIPKLIDVKLDTSIQIPWDMFKTELNAIAPYAQVDSHRIWLSQLVDISKGIQKTIFIILTLLILTTAFTVIYTTRSGLLVQMETLSLLQMIGAKDSSIAMTVAIHAFLRSFFGGCFGFVFSLPIVFIVMTLVDGQTDSFFSYGALSIHQWVIVALIPVIIATLVFTTALATALKRLRSF